MKKDVACSLAGRFSRIWWPFEWNYCPNLSPQLADSSKNWRWRWESGWVGEVAILYFFLFFSPEDVAIASAGRLLGIKWPIWWKHPRIFPCRQKVHRRIHSGGWRVSNAVMGIGVTGSSSSGDAWDRSYHSHQVLITLLEWWQLSKLLVLPMDLLITGQKGIKEQQGTSNNKTSNNQWTDRRGRSCRLNSWRLQAGWSLIQQSIS